MQEPKHDDHLGFADRQAVAGHFLENSPVPHLGASCVMWEFFGAKGSFLVQKVVLQRKGSFPASSRRRALVFLLYHAFYIFLYEWAFSQPTCCLVGTKVPLDAGGDLCLALFYYFIVVLIFVSAESTYVLYSGVRSVCVEGKECVVSSACVQVNVTTAFCVGTIGERYPKFPRTGAFCTSVSGQHGRTSEQRGFADLV